MKKIQPDVLLNRLSDLSKKLSAEASQEFGGLTQEQLHWNPDKNSWSIAQCIAHINAFYRFYVPVFIERIENSRFQEPSDIFQSSPLGNSTYIRVKLGKVKNVKRKLKSPKDYNPLVNRNLNIEGVLDEFVTNQNKLIEILEAAKKINIRKTKTSFSIRPIVKLRIGDAFQYMVYHCERHIEQANKVKSSPRFPVS